MLWKPQTIQFEKRLIKLCYLYHWSEFSVKCNVTICSIQSYYTTHFT